MSDERVLAVIATHIRPAVGYGGVAESTAELILHWVGSSRSVIAVCSDASHGPKLTEDLFRNALGCETFSYGTPFAKRWGFGLGAFGAIVKAVRRANGVYVSGIGTWPTTIGAWIAILLRKPLTIAPRGGLMKEHWQEIRTNKPFKYLFYQIFTLPSLRRAQSIHATSEIEASDLAKNVPGAKRVFVAPNLVGLRAASDKGINPPDVTGGLRLIYLGRLSREKGVLPFLEEFCRIKQASDLITVAGPVSDDTGRRVVDLCRSEQNCFYAGVVPRDSIPDVLRQHHALVLPSGVGGDTRENFGNVVLEALAAGRLTAVTRGLAWDGIEDKGVGVTFGRDLDDLPSSLTQLRLLAADEMAWTRCAAFAAEHFNPATTAQHMWDQILA